MTESRRAGDRGEDGGRPLSAVRPSHEIGGMLVFGADGHLVASTESGPWDHGRAVTTVRELEHRYRQTDGMPIDLGQRGRHVAVPIDGQGPSVILVSQPLEPANGLDATLAVAIDPFRGESDPEMLQRALGSVLAHELRTPMTTVYGGAELLLRPGLSDASRTEAARSVVHAAERLHRVIEDLVVLVRWQGDRSDDEEPVLLQPLIRGVLRRFEDRPVRIAIDAPPDVPSVLASPLVVDQVVTNLLEHAIANSPADGEVRVVVRGSGDRVELVVADDGPSLSEDERERAFELFAPSSRRGADASGANLPLVAARRLVERLGGTVEAARPQRGGEMVVRLPAVLDGDERPEDTRQPL